MVRHMTEPATVHQTDRGLIPAARPSTTQEPTTGLVQSFVGGEGRVEGMERYGMLVARILIAQIFLLSGVMKVLDPSGTAAQMEGRGMFWVPFFLVGAIIFELGGGLSLLLGYKARLGALALFLFLIPVTLTFHNWWTYADPKEQHVNMLFFFHNLTLMGGLLLVMVVGPGPLSLDRRRRRAS
jgi:putative oxidoreductase